LVPFWRLKKGLAVRAKPPEAAPEATDIPPNPMSLVGPKAATAKKKGATEVAPKCLACPSTQKNLLAPLMRILPDKKSKPCKKQHHQPNRQDPGKHHVIEKHDWPPGPCFAAMSAN
jgi:hypothetical protein